MGKIKVKRGSGVPSGLTAWEIAYDFTNDRFYIGNTTGASVLLAYGGGGVRTVNGLTGGITFAAGTNIGITSSGNIITISATGLSAAASDFVSQGKLSANVGITSGADYVIPFVDDYDPQNWYDPTTKQFKPNIAGYYEISLSAWWAQAGITNAQSNVQARKNGTDTFLIAQNQTQTGSGYSIGGTKTIFLNGSTDYVDFTAYTSNTTSQTLQYGTSYGSGTWFTAFLIANSTPPTAYVSSFNGLTGAVTGVSSVNGSTGAIIAVNSFNGRTGAVQGVSAASAGTGISLSGSTGAITITNTGVVSFNGLTGTVTGVSSVNGSTGSITAVNSFNGRTGAVQGVSSASAGTGIALSGSTGAITITNIGVQSFNGSTGAVSGVSSLDTGYGPQTGAVDITGVMFDTYNVWGYPQEFSGAVGSFFGYPALNVKDSTTGNYISIDCSQTPSHQGEIEFGNTAYSTILKRSSSTTGDYTVYLPENSGYLVTSGGVVTSVNGATGAVTAVVTVSGGAGILAQTDLSGNVSLTNTGVQSVAAGSGISVSGSTGAVTITNTGVQSVNGATGAVTNVARTNTNNNFSASQSISTSGPSLTISDSVLVNFSSLNTSNLQFYNDVTAATQVLQSNTNSVSSTITLPGTSTTLAGLSLAQTFTNTNTFSSTIIANSGLCAAGSTFNGLIRANAGISASGGTFSGTIQGTTATFTGLITSAAGFSGPSTQILATDTSSSSTFYPTFVGGTGNQAVFVDVSGADSLLFIPSTSTITATNLNLRGGLCAAGGTFTGLLRANAGLSFAGATFSGVMRGSGSIRSTGDVTAFRTGAANTSVTLGNNSVSFYESDITGATLSLTGIATSGNVTITIPGSVSTTLAGLGNSQTFSGTNTFSSIIAANGGLSAAGSTFTGLTRFTAGISAAGGMTLSGTVNLNGQTFTNLVHSLNGFTGAVGAWLTNPGFTTAAQTWNDGTSNGSKTMYYLPTTYINPGDWGSYVVAANRAYFTLFNTSKRLTIKTIRALTNSTVTTGNAFISVYSADVNTGLPSTRLYNSASLAVGSGFGGISVTNAGGLVTVPAGFFYVSTIFSSTPTMFAFQRYKIPHIYGASSYSAGTYNIMPLADYSGFTTAAQLPTAGVTLGYLEATAGNYTGVVVEIAI